MAKTLFHITLSALLLISTTGITINMHFCQGELYDLVFNTPADDCCANDPDYYICHQDHEMTESHHCDDKSIKIYSIHDFLVSGFSFDFNNLHSFELFSKLQSMLESPDIKKSFTATISNNKKPPQEVVLSQIQSFLN